MPGVFKSRDWPLSPEQEPPEGARAIRLTQGFVAWVDADDYEQLADREWYTQISEGRRAYARRSVYPDGSTVAQAELMHQVILPASDGLEVDHREHRFDQKIVDNRRCNLRLCAHQQNSQNLRKSLTGSSQYKGVTRFKRISKWGARIRIGGKNKWLGAFSNEHFAALAYDYAARQHYGEYALTNFPTVEGRWKESLECLNG